MEAQFSFVRPHAKPKVAVWRPPLLIGWKLKSCGNALFSGPSIRQWKWLCLLLPLVLLLDHTSKSRQQQQQQQQQWVPLENQNGRNHSKLVYFLWKLIKFNVIGWTLEKRNVCHLDACWWQRQRINELKFVDHVTHSTPMRGSCSNNNGGKAVGFDLIGPRLLTRPLASLSSFRTNETNQHDWW